MLKSLIILSVWAVLAFLAGIARADSFSLSEKETAPADHIIPLIYIDNIKFYNGSSSAAYTKKIAEQLAFEPKIIITEEEQMADYILIPKLLQSRIEPISAENSRYSMSIALELWSKGGILIDSIRQNRYIIIENMQNQQQIAQKLLIRLLTETVSVLSLKIKNNLLSAE